MNKNKYGYPGSIGSIIFAIFIVILTKSRIQFTDSYENVPV